MAASEASQRAASHASAATSAAAQASHSAERWAPGSYAAHIVQIFCRILHGSAWLKPVSCRRSVCGHADELAACRALHAASRAQAAAAEGFARGVEIAQQQAQVQPMVLTAAGGERHHSSAGAHCCGVVGQSCHILRSGSCGQCLSWEAGAVLGARQPVLVRQCVSSAIPGARSAGHGHGAGAHFIRTSRRAEVGGRQGALCSLRGRGWDAGRRRRQCAPVNALR